MSKIDKKGLTKAQLEYITKLEEEIDSYKNDGAKDYCLSSLVSLETLLMILVV